MKHLLSAPGLVIHRISPLHCKDNKEGSIVSSYWLRHCHHRGGREAECDALILTVVSELDAGRQGQLCSVCWAVLRPVRTERHREKVRRKRRTSSKVAGRIKTEDVGVSGSDLLSCCSPLIIGLTMPLSISSLPELCKHITIVNRKKNKIPSPRI